MKISFLSPSIVLFLSLATTACMRPSSKPLRYTTSLANRVLPEDENAARWLKSGSPENVILDSPAVITYFTAPNQPFLLSLVADREVAETGRLFPVPGRLDPDSPPVTLEKLTLKKNRQPINEITNFDSETNQDNPFTYALPNLTSPASPGETDRYKFVGYWKGKGRGVQSNAQSKTLVQGLWIDVTTRERAQDTGSSDPLAAIRLDKLRLQIGGTLATEGGKDEYDTGEDTKHPLKPGFLLGASLPWQVSPLLSVEAGLQVETKGAAEKHSYEDDYYPGQGSASVESFRGSRDLASRALLLQTETTFTNKTRLTYLGFPLLARINPFPSVANLGLIAGLQPSFLLGRVSKFGGFGNTATERGNDGFKTVDLGLLLGANYQLDSGLGFRLVYEHGLTDITDNSFDVFRNRAIKVSATYDLPIDFLNQ